MEEKFKWIPGYAGRYMVSNYGRVKSFFYYGKEKERFLIPSKNCFGYFRVTLTSKKKKSKSFGVHQLVALAFIKNKMPEKFIEVNHIDHNPGNNYFKNLEWVTRSQNIKHSYNNPIRKRYSHITKSFGI